MGSEMCIRDRFNRLPDIDNIHAFSFFNRTTGLNDIYIKSEADSFVYSTSTLVTENQVFNPFNARVDSFNPNGSKDLGNAVVSGVLSLLFNN